MNPASDLLRALTRLDSAAAERHFAIEDEEWGRYADTVAAAFYLAVHERFGGRDRGEVVTWVASLRARAADPDELDPVATEHLIWSAVSDDADLGGSVDKGTVVDIELVVVPQLLHERNLSDDELDAFLRAGEHSRGLHGR